MTRFTEEELEGLTEEEREALLAEDEDTGTDDAEEEEAENEESGTEADEGDEDADADDGATDGDDDGEADDESSQDDDGKDQIAAKQAQPAPILTADDPEGAEDRLKEIAEAKEKLIEQFDDGELTAKEYQLELDKLAKQEREIERAIDRADLARDMAAQQARNEWLSTVNRFLSEHPQYQQSPLMHRTLDTAVRELASKEENANLTGAEILQKAHEQIVTEFGLKQAASGKGEGKKAPRKMDVPPTLAKVPASDMTETENTRWSKLDRLMERDPERYEEELAKLSDSDREAYLQAQ